MIKQLLRIIPDTLKDYFKNRHFVIMFSAFILVMVYGYHGNLELLNYLTPKWPVPGVNTCCREPIISWIPWDREFISFTGGFVILVIIPVLIIVFGFKEPISKYGILLPPKGKRLTGLLTYILLVIVFGPIFYFISNDKSMQEVYPFYKGFTSVNQFLAYELICLSLFITVEFIFRDTPESHEVAKKMAAHDPHYTIHLGDTYYVGAPHEVKLNFVRHNSPWLRGSKARFAISGNQVKTGEDAVKNDPLK